MKYHIIYETTNLINKKIYIGAHSTNNLDDNYLGSGDVITAAIKKYGKENFKKRILAFCTSAEAMYEKEKELVNEEFVKRRDTYNVCGGGIGPSYVTEKTRKKISEGNKGKIQSDSVKRKISASMKGHNVSEETRKKIGKGNKGKTGRCGIENAFYNKTHTEEAKRKIGEASRKRISGNKGKKQKIVSCPHCNKTGGHGTMQRWHFDNCPIFLISNNYGEVCNHSLDLHT